jgi:hypothetical protein
VPVHELAVRKVFVRNSAAKLSKTMVVTACATAGLHTFLITGKQIEFSNDEVSQTVLRHVQTWRFGYLGL